MSYAQKRQIGTNRTFAIVIVAIVHVIIGYGIFTGLAYNVIEQVTQDLKTFNVEVKPPPPPDEPPPPPPEQPPETPQPVVSPPVVSPPPIVRIKIKPPPVQTVKQAPPPVITPRAVRAPPAPPRRPPPPPPPPPPPRVKTVPPRSATGNLQRLFRGRDYPRAAIERDEQGSVTVRLTVGTNGRVSSCNILNSSRSRTLDRTTCRILQSRARFTPARNNRGNPTTDTVTQRIRWVLAD